MITHTTTMRIREFKYTWDVYKLWEISKKISIKKVNPKALEENLNCDMWGFSKGDFTGHTFLAHMKRIEDADFSHPLLVTEEGKILDGCHRLCKAIYNKHKSVNIIVLPEKLILKEYLL